MRARQAGAGPPKKLTIKPLRAAPTLPPDFEATTWSKLGAAVAAVHDKQPVGFSLEELYRAVEDLCMHKLAPGTHVRLEQQCAARTAERLGNLAAHASDPPHIFLPLALEAWTDHCNQTLTVRSIFLYLDRTYLLQTPGVKPLWEMGLAHFRHELVRQRELLGRLVNGCLMQIERERGGELIDRGLVQGLTRMLSALGLYEDTFEGPLVERTTAFYATESSRVLSSESAAAYLKFAETRIAEEVARCQACLHSSSRKPLLAAAQGALIAPHVPTLLDKGLVHMVDEARIEDLSRMYALFGHVGAHRQLRDAWSAHIKRVGTDMVLDSEREKTLVEDLLRLKEKCDTLHTQAFDRAEAFGYALREAFEALVNAKQNKPAELIAKFLDQQLRAKAGSESDLEVTLDHAMALFRFINGKDLFEAFFKKDLAKRLLLGKLASVDAEKLLISKLKAECGAGFTNKLEGMFKDVDASHDLMQTFREAQETGRLPRSDIELNVHVLTTGFWPNYPPVEVKLPSHLAKVLEVFGDFYLSKHSGRRVSWAHSLGHCTLKARFPLAPQGVHELQVSLLQALVLLHFNSTDEASLETLAEATGLEDRELRLTLQSLACGKVRVLVKEPKGRDVVDGDRFIYNHDFQHKLHRVKINAIQMKESVEEQEATSEKVFVDRQYQIDAAIVRVMKSRKSLSHTLLLTELFAQLKFPLKPQDLKKRIESLIDREYLERDTKNPQVYRYLA